MTQEELIKRINELKKAKNAIILAHNYELGEIQDIADFCGDSLELSIKAANTDNDLIVFCGVRFMAETAKMLSPDKKVILPVAHATCEMAEMIDGEQLRAIKKEYPNSITVAYVNSTAETKAECDLCVTSSNALKIIASLPKDKHVIFVPDRNLGSYCKEQTNHNNMYLYDGFCPVHDRLTVEVLKKRKAEFPNAEVLIHPESRKELVELADHALSTGKILTYVRESDKKEFIIVTEIGILHRLEKENPDKKFIPISCEAVCPHMKLIRLENVLEALEKEENEIILDKEIMEKAAKPIRAMLELSK